MICQSDRNVTVGVVDGDCRYHDSLLPLSIRSRTPFRFYATGGEALRRSRSDRNAVWLISLDLPDMSGFDLFEMLRDRLRGTSVCLVAVTYRLEDELRAYRTGAGMYACRPVELAWLGQCLRRLCGEAVDHLPAPPEDAPRLALPRRHVKEMSPLFL